MKQEIYPNNKLFNILCQKFGCLDYKPKLFIFKDGFYEPIW